MSVNVAHAKIYDTTAHAIPEVSSYYMFYALFLCWYHNIFINIICAAWMVLCVFILGAFGKLGKNKERMEQQKKPKNNKMWIHDEQKKKGNIES